MLVDCGDAAMRAISLCISNVPTVSMLATTIGTPVHSRFECRNLKVRFKSTSDRI